MTLTEKCELKSSLVEMYVALKEIKKKNVEEMLEEELIVAMSNFHSELEEYLK